MKKVIFVEPNEAVKKDRLRDGKSKLKNHSFAQNLAPPPSPCVLFLSSFAFVESDRKNKIATSRWNKIFQLCEAADTNSNQYAKSEQTRAHACLNTRKSNSFPASSRPVERPTGVSRVIEKPVYKTQKRQKTIKKKTLEKIKCSLLPERQVERKKSKDKRFFRNENVRSIIWGGFS